MHLREYFRLANLAEVANPSTCVEFIAKSQSLWIQFVDKR